MSEVIEENQTVPDVTKDDIKEPEEPDHQENCHLLNDKSSENEEADLSGGGDAQDGAEQKEKGQMDEDPEIKKDDVEDSGEKDEKSEDSEEKKDESDGWIYVLGHNLLKKKVVKEGEGVASRPINGQVVTVKYSATIHESEDGKIVDSNESKSFVVGDGEFLMAFDLCVALMQKGEVCEVVTDAKYTYGEKGKEPDIPGNASLHYTIEMLDVKNPPDPAKMSSQERVTSANERRERGNDLYSNGNYTSAINSYTKALKFVDIQYDAPIKDEEELTIVKETRIKCYNNLAAAQLKVDAWDAAIKSSNEVLKYEPENVKALFRKGKCLAGKGDVSGAITILRKTLKLEPETKIIHQELSRLVNKQKREDEKTKNMYKRMLGTDKQQSEQTIAKRQKSRWWWAAYGATAAAVVSVGLGVYRHLHQL